MEQIERIQYMEQILDEASLTMQDLTENLASYQNLLSRIKELACYYEGPLWMKDFEDDENHLLPENLKRGVLSQDAVYDLLCKQDELFQSMDSLIQALKNERS